MKFSQNLYRMDYFYIFADLKFNQNGEKQKETSIYY